MRPALPTASRDYSVLLSAYACEPGIGSEAAVGWGWALNLAKAGCRVHVLTRASNRARIEVDPVLGELPNLEFAYFDLPRWLRFWKRGNRGVHLYYVLWQFGAFLMARKMVRNVRIDIVHHVTFVTARFPSFMGWLGLPFVFGPLAGGEYAPRTLWWGLGYQAIVKESLRYLTMAWWRFSPLLNMSFAKARRIYATSRETRQRLPCHAQKKTEVMLGIGLESSEAQSHPRQPGGSFEILYAGRFLYWKGMEYGLEAFARLVEKNPDSRLTLLGDGPALERWRGKCSQLGLDEKVRWRKAVPRDEFLSGLCAYDVLLFPSLHDSGGMVVLEAMAAGVPIVCLDIGGPGVLVDETCGFKVSADAPAKVVDGLQAALGVLAEHRDLAAKMGEAGRQRAEAVFSWEGRVARMLCCYDELLGVARSENH